MRNNYWIWLVLLGSLLLVVIFGNTQEFLRKSEAEAKTKQRSEERINFLRGIDSSVGANVLVWEEPEGAQGNIPVVHQGDGTIFATARWHKNGMNLPAGTLIIIKVNPDAKCAWSASAPFWLYDSNGQKEFITKDSHTKGVFHGEIRVRIANDGTTFDFYTLNTN